MGLAAVAAVGIAVLAMERTPSLSPPVYGIKAGGAETAAVTPDPTAVEPTSAGTVPNVPDPGAVPPIEPLTPDIKAALARAESSLADVDRLLGEAGVPPPEPIPQTAPTALSTRLVELRERFHDLEAIRD